MSRLVLLLAMLASLLGSTLHAAPKNIVMLVADDLGLQLGCYGDPDAKTPNLDRLAAEGTRFTRSYCTTASCSASRSVILTGQYNHAIAHYGHAHGEGHFSTFANVRTLPVILKEAGYRSCSIGKYHVEPEATYHFDQYANDGPAKDTHNPVGMAQNMKQFIVESKDQPFFVYFCGTDAHRSGKGFANEKQRDGVTSLKYDPAKITLPAWLPDLPESRQEWAEYLEAVNRWDQGVGAVLKALSDTGHMDDTLILTLSDNGPPFPGAKTTTYEPGIKLPLIVRHPEQKKRGVVTAAGVNWTDLAPTVLEFAGVKSPGGRVAKNGKVTGAMHGRSFLGALEQEHLADRDEVYFSHTFHEVTMYYPMRGVVSGRYKYIFNVAAPLPFPFASDLYASHTWQAVLRGGVKQYGQRSTAGYLQRATHELYDLQADPHETRNLATDPQHAETLKALQAKVQKFQETTNDPWFSKWTYE
jgi:N-sulfoglucosamine sulfohydrolase